MPHVILVHTGANLVKVKCCEMVPYARLSPNKHIVEQTYHRVNTDPAKTKETMSVVNAVTVKTKVSKSV